MIEPVLIEPEALYDDTAIGQALGLTPSALAAARRERTLRYTRKGKRTLYKGEWILEWLESEPAARQSEGGES
jgi:hypothetical protein